MTPPKLAPRATSEAEPMPVRSRRRNTAASEANCAAVDSGLPPPAAAEGRMRRGMGREERGQVTARKAMAWARDALLVVGNVDEKLDCFSGTKFPIYIYIYIVFI